MKYMEGWSYEDLMGCPVDYIAVINEIARDDADAFRSRRRR